MEKNERRSRPGDGPERVYVGLRRAIIGQELAPGIRLPEETIATRFGVSRTVVRAALGRLASEGLVVWPNNHSATVARPSMAEAADLFSLRQVLESVVIDRLAGQLDAEAVARLNAHVDRERSVGGHDAAEAIRLAGEFHVLLAELTRSPLLARYVADLVSRASLLIAGTARPHSSSCAVAEHTELIAMLERGDIPSARAAMAMHLAHVAGRAKLDNA